MNILVCVKQVPDTTEIKIDPVTHRLMREGVPSIMNPFDAYALETALRIKDVNGAHITVISMGLPQAGAVLKEALAVGADEICLVSDRPFGGADTLATSYTLSMAAKALEEKQGAPFDLIFCGKQAIDGDTAQVGPEMAEHLGRPQVTYAVSAELVEGGVRVRRETDSGYDIVQAGLPALISVTKTPYELRFPKIRNKMASLRATVPVLTAADLKADSERIGGTGSATRVKRSFTPDVKKSGVLLKGISGTDAAAKLAAALEEAHLV